MRGLLDALAPAKGSSADMRIPLNDLDLSRCTALTTERSSAASNAAGASAVTSADGVVATLDASTESAVTTGVGRAVGNSGPAVGELAQLARALTRSGGLRGSLMLSRIAMGDEDGACFISELARRPSQSGQALLLTHLDLSHNALRAGFVSALSHGLAGCAQLTSLRYMSQRRASLGSRLCPHRCPQHYSRPCHPPLLSAPHSIAHNPLGSQAGSDALVAALALPSLRILDASGINLCDCSPSIPSHGPPEWSAAALQTLASVLVTTGLTDLHLHSNEICGCWCEQVCGEATIRGSYTSLGLGMLIAALEGDDRLSLRKEGLKLEQGNHLQPSDTARLHKALALNSVKIPRVGVIPPSSEVSEKGPSASLAPARVAGQPTAGGLSHPTEEAAPVGGVMLETEKPRGDLALLMEMNLTPRGSPVATNADATNTDVINADAAKGSLQLDMGLDMGLLGGIVNGAKEMVENAKGIVAKALDAGSDNSPPPVQVNRSSLSLSMKDTAKAGGGGQPRESPRRAKASGGARLGVINSEGAPPIPSKVPRGSAASATKTSGAKAPNSARGGAPGGAPLNSARGSQARAMPFGGAPAPVSGVSPPGGRSFKSSDNVSPPGGRSFKSSKPAPLPDAAALPSPRSSPDTVGAKEGGSGYGLAKKKKKKKVVEAVEEEELSPFAKSPLMIVMNVLWARKEAALDSPVVGKVVVGSLVRVGETKVLNTKVRNTKMVEEHRMLVELEGDNVALGWVTGRSSGKSSDNDDENLLLAAAGFPLMTSIRRLQVRKGKEADSERVGDVQKDERLRIMDTALVQDGREEKVTCARHELAVEKRLADRAACALCLPLACTLSLALRCW